MAAKGQIEQGLRKVSASVKPLSAAFENQKNAFEKLSETLSDMDGDTAELLKTYKEKTKLLSSAIANILAEDAWLKRKVFGTSTEKAPAYDPTWPYLFPDMIPDNAEEIKKAGEEAQKEIAKMAEEKKEKKIRRRMLEDVPVTMITKIEPKDIDLNVYKLVKNEETQQLHYIPGKMYVEKIIRPVYALRNDVKDAGKPGYVTAPMPFFPIYKGIPAASLLAEILLKKYEYHEPFYRFIKECTHLGIKGLKENTLVGWFKYGAELLKPLLTALEKEVFKSGYLQVDETTVPVINHDSKKAAKEYLWMARAVMEGLVIFHYENGSRASRVIQDLAKNFKGYLQCDGFGGYETAFNANPDVCLVNCMAHIRRKFEQAKKENEEAADFMFKKIQALYRLEQVCTEKGLTPEERKAERERFARPLMGEMKQWMEQEGFKLSPASLTGKAVTYAYKRWDNMMHYLEDGRIRIDNNLAENEIRPITLGRKNYLFCGNDSAAENMSVICSLLSTCRNHGVNPRDYLIDVLTRMPYMQKASHEELVSILPHNWKPLSNPYELYTGGVVTTQIVNT